MLQCTALCTIHIVFYYKNITVYPYFKTEIMMLDYRESTPLHLLGSHQRVTVNVS